MLDAVASGLGIGVLPCFITTDADLVCLGAVGGPQAEQIWLVTHPDTRDIVRVRVTLDWIKGVFERHAEQLSRSR